MFDGMVLKAETTKEDTVRNKIDTTEILRDSTPSWAQQVKEFKLIIIFNVLLRYL